MIEGEAESRQVVPSLTEQLTTNFYRWERWGRGWHYWDEVVDLEPPFAPFYHFYVPTERAVDDGRRPTLLSNLIDRIKGRFVPQPEPEEQFYPIWFEDPEPAVLCEDADLHGIRISLPVDCRVPLDAAEQLLLGLNNCSLPLSFEIVGEADSIAVQLVCRQPDLAAVRQQVEGFFPDAVLYPQADVLDALGLDQDKVAMVDFGLGREFMRPLRRLKGLDPDPLTAIIAGLQDVAAGEIGLLQVLFEPARCPWAESILRSVSDWQGGSFFADCPDMLRLAREKVERPLFAATVRVAARAETTDRAWEIARTLAAEMLHLADPVSNELIPLVNDGYDDDLHLEDVCCRRTRRSGMLLNSRELVGLVHFPSVSIRSPKLRRELKQTKAAPTLACGHQFVLGANLHRGQETVVSLIAEQRLRHMHVIGATGTGKSTLLLKLVVQDIEKGLGVGVLDPHGDLVDRIIERIPEERFADVVLIDPSDTAYSVGLNILSAYSELDQTVLASDLVATFRRLSTSWGDQMNSVFGNAIMAFLESAEGGTLEDLRRFLVENEYRRRFLQTVQDRNIVYYWNTVFPKLGGRTQGPILTRLDTFLRPKPIRYMVTQKEGLNFQEILDSQKIFLAKLSHGLIGMENAYLLGAIIATKFHQAAMARQAQAAGQRKEFYLYIDEFQNFATESMAEILSGARKYRLGLILAHQELRQLFAKDSELASSVISNPGTRVCFRLGDFDAKKLADGFSYFDARDLQSLGVGEAIARIERSEYDFNLKTAPPGEVAPDVARQRRDEVVNLSRQKYARPRREIEPPAAPEEVSEQPTQVPSTDRVAVTEKAAVVEQPVPAARPKKLETKVASLPGRGGQDHKYHQQLIRQAAEAHGYRALIEQGTPDGAGSADVHLERDGKKIACEISLTTSDTQELGNIQKRLAAGYDQVLLCSPQKRFLERAKKRVHKHLEPSQRPKVSFLLLPAEIVEYFKQGAAQGASGEKFMKGWKVKTQFKSVPGGEEEGKMAAISRAILGSAKRIRGTK